MKKPSRPRQIDVKALAEAAATLEGAEPLAGLARLASESVGDPAGRQIRWKAAGALRNAGHVRPEVWLHLQADTQVALTCQRCLTPVAVDLAVDRSYRFVADEATAAAEDDESEEDVLALTRSLDLLELVEDEFLMALPLVPRHERCPESLPMSASDPGFEAATEARARPFAGLAGLKSGKDQSNQ